MKNSMLKCVDVLHFQVAHRRNHPQIVYKLDLAGYRISPATDSS